MDIINRINELNNELSNFIEELTEDNLISNKKLDNVYNMSFWKDR